MCALILSSTKSFSRYNGFKTFREKKQIEFEQYLLRGKTEQQQQLYYNDYNTSYNKESTDWY